MEPNDAVGACLGWLKLGWCLSDVPRMSKMKKGREEGHTFILYLFTPPPSHCCFPLQPLKSTDRGKKEVKFKSVSNPWTTASRSPHG